MTTTTTEGAVEHCGKERIPIADRHPNPARRARADLGAAGSSGSVPFTAILLVTTGGLFGAAAREAIEQLLPTAPRAFPVATFLINLTGAFILGFLLEALVRS